MKRGIAHLPLHYGKAPAWLFSRMKKLAAEITLVIVHESGTDGFLEKISDPFWFQAFGCVLGFDWHSSGLTTTSLGALKEGMKDVSKEIGLYVCGGKGATSRKTPLEIDAIASRSTKEIPAEKFIYASRMSAKVDSSALQDGYQLYHHCFLFDHQGNWAVVQQGMNDTNRMARRYHWLGKKALNFVCEPHTAVCCNRRSKVLNMTAAASEGCRDASTSLAREEPKRVIKEYEQIRRLDLSPRHSVSVHDIKSENLRRILEKTYEKKPADFEALLGSGGVGPKTIRALSLIAELIYGKPSSIEDPVRFSFAHGGKDGHPYPVNKEEYDRSIDILREAVNLSRIGRTDKMKALKRLNENF